jgi:aldehyde dehydrogenase (NAD+)
MLTDSELLSGGLLIGNTWVHSSSGGTMAHINPATGEEHARFAVAGIAEMDAAVAAACSAQKDWAGWPPAERRAALQRIAALLRDNAQELSRITTLETGRPVSLAQRIALDASSWFEYYAGWIDKIAGDVVPMPGFFNYTAHEPCGVVAVLLTWNGPTGLIGMKVAAALAAGCTVVLKPPELAPFSGSFFGRLALEAGLPAGVLNVVPGGPEAGDHLVRHPGVDKISFTGSPATGARIQAACAQNLTPLVLELGGKSANIVLADAELDAACASAASGLARLSGQVCVAPTRLIVESSVYEEVLERVANELSKLPVGDPWDPGSFMGPLISAQARLRGMGMVEQARMTGSGRLMTGGEPLGGELAAGYYMAPTIFRDVPNSSPLAQEEAFAPLLAAMSVDSVEQAVEVANDTRYGLAAYVHTTNLKRALQLAGRLDAGNVSINGGLPLAGPVAPFGGFKDSGYGKEGGREGLMEFVRTKNVNISMG